jgi:hypothetical protein
VAALRAALDAAYEQTSALEDASLRAQSAAESQLSSLRRQMEEFKAKQTQQEQAAAAAAAAAATTAAVASRPDGSVSDRMGRAEHRRLGDRLGQAHHSSAGLTGEAWLCELRNALEESEERGAEATRALENVLRVPEHRPT